MNTDNSYSAKPFVKWVGGKTRLLSDIKRSLPKDLAQRENVTYVEPFVGGGAVLFWILQEYPNISRAVINDVNAELICTYRIIKNDMEALIGELSKMQTEYIPLGCDARAKYFYEKRNLFNSGNTPDVQTAALFIFLNRTCFNGLYRVNAKGGFNVPHGKYSNPKICDPATLRADSELLQKVEIICGDFSKTGRYAGENVLYYFDPPYRPLTETSSFTAYSAGGFNDAEQERLRDFCTDISKKGALFIASNSDPQNADKNDLFFDKLYKKFAIRRVSASRMINSRGDRRGAVSELMISNL